MSQTIYTYRLRVQIEVAHALHAIVCSIVCSAEARDVARCLCIL